MLFRRKAYVFITCFCSIIASASRAEPEPVIIPPAKLPEGPLKLLLLIPSLAPAHAYTALALEIQKQVSFRLSIGIVNCRPKFDNTTLCDPEFELDGLLLNIIEDVNKTANGALKPGDIFIGGQSVGGAAARRFADTQFAGLAGVLLFGTQYNGDGERMLPFVDYLGYPMDLEAYPRPLLALTGELDMFPISHTALMIGRWEKLAEKERLRKYPAIIPGLSQSSYAPSYPTSGDLVPEVSAEEGLKSIAGVTGAWLDYVVLNSSEAVGHLNEQLAVTRPIAFPFLAAMTLDRQWCGDAQMKLPGVPHNATVEVVHAPFLKLESCHTKHEMKDGVLHLTVCDYSAYTYGHRPPWQPSFAGAVDISCKMIGENRIAQECGLEPPDMGAPDVKNRCQEINRRSWKRAISIVQASHPAAVNRFVKQGKDITFLNDTQTKLGPQWLMEGMIFREYSRQVNISGVALITSLQSLIYPGNHYCKLLAPSVAVELIMTMGLTSRIPQQQAGAMKDVFV